MSLNEKIKKEIRLRQILSSKTILTPNQQFKTLLLDDKDFITFNQLCDISRKETLEKLYALRDLCNIEKPDYNLIKGIAYSEKIRPVLTLLFSQDATSRYVSETFEISVNQAKELEDDNNTEELSKSKKQKKRANVVPAYSIDPDTLDRLLNTKKTTSQIDQYLIENQQPLLKLYKEYLDAEIFYPDFFTIDSTGNFEISSKHENYIAVGNNDSIIIPEKFGNINIYYGSGMITGYNRTYNPKTEDIRNSSDEICNDDLPERVFIHKALLPTNYRKPQK